MAVGPRQAAFVEYEWRDISPDQVKVRVQYASPKHGSELAAFRGEIPQTADYYDDGWHTFLQREEGERMGEPFGYWNLGNQWVGTIAEVGTDVAGFKHGDTVGGYGGIRESHIVTIAGEDSLLHMPSGMSWKSAVCFDPAQFAFGAMRDGHVRLGDTVAVFGLGAIGQIAAKMARIAGASLVAVVDPIEKRRSAAIAAGADIALDPLVDDVGLYLKRETGKLSW